MLSGLLICFLAHRLPEPRYISCATHGLPHFLSFIFIFLQDILKSAMAGVMTIAEKAGIKTEPVGGISMKRIVSGEALV
jgi:hypothetical protein